MKTNFFFLLCALTILGGCRVGPTYPPPIVSVPPNWKACPETHVAPYCENWWEVFCDPCLSELETKALQSSPNLYIAYSKIMEARGLAGIERADLFPQVTLDPSYLNQGILFKLYGIPQGDFPGLREILRIHQFQYYLPIDMSYEIDLWGKIKSEYLSAVYDAQAEMQAFRTTLLSLTTDLASHYYNLRALDAEIGFYQKEIVLRQKSLELTQLRYEDGLVSLLDVTSAKVELSNLQADYVDLVRQRRIFENAISVLVGENASNFCLSFNPLNGIPPSIPPGVPCSILLKRPDLLELERRRAAEHVLIGAAYASFLPSLTLTGTLGFFSPTLQDFLTWKSRLWAIGMNIAQTLFDGGRKFSNLKVAWSRFHEADGVYQQTVLQAFQEVEDALNNLDLQKWEYHYLEESVDSSNQRRLLSQKRFDEGLVNYFEVIDSERTEIDAERNFINVLGMRYQSTIQLIKAIGGNWDSVPIEAFCERKMPTSSESQQQ